MTERSSGTFWWVLLGANYTGLEPPRWVVGEVYLNNSGAVEWLLPGLDVFLAREGPDQIIRIGGQIQPPAGPVASADADPERARAWDLSDRCQRCKEKRAEVIRWHEKPRPYREYVCRDCATVNERITEAELRTVERLEEGDRSALLFARRLVSEVRRLRGLIEAAHRMYGGPMVPAVALSPEDEAIENEAQTIRGDDRVPD